VSPLWFATLESLLLMRISAAVVYFSRVEAVEFGAVSGVVLSTNRH